MNCSKGVFNTMADLNNFIIDFKSLVVESITTHFPAGLKNIYVVGSFSSGEITILSDFISGEVYMSDIDIIVDVDFLTFLKCQMTGVAHKLSERLTTYVTSKGVKSHVSISVASLRLFDLLRFLKPQNSVYLYELTPFVFNEKQFIVDGEYKRSLPNKIDCLNLVFSSIADYVFVKLDFSKENATNEHIYILAKRCLTLLYSLLLFKGLTPQTYSQRITVAKRFFDKLDGILSEDDLKILEKLVEYKLTGNWKVLCQNLDVNPKIISNLFVFLDRYFIKLATKVSAYELSRICQGETVTRFSNISSDNLLDLIEVYKTTVKVSVSKLPLVTLQYFFSFLCEKKSAKLKVALLSLLNNRLRIDDLIRCNMFVVFLSLVTDVPDFGRSYVLETKRQWFLYLM